MAARVYADVPGNKCACGGKFTKRVPYDEDEPTKVPRCESCNKLPSLFRIDADAKDANGKSVRVWIRNTSERTPQRLDKIAKVMTTLETIQREITDGIFDIRNYDSAVSAEKFLFKNYVDQYLREYEEKLLAGKINIKSLDGKRSMIKIHLIPFFGTRMLRDITGRVIQQFRNKCTKRIHFMALAELRCILNQAERDEMLTRAPSFENIPKSEKRKEVITLEVALKTISKVKGQAYKDLLTLMTIYPLRPSEMRALRWIDITDTHLHVAGHFSDNLWAEGRKSIKADQRKGTLKYPLTPEAREIFRKNKTNIASISRVDDFIFKGANGEFIKKEALCHAWRVARKALGHTHELYEIRHRCLTDYGSKSNGNIIKMLNFSGHTNASTLIERYIRDTEEIEM